MLCPRCLLQSLGWRLSWWTLGKGEGQRKRRAVTTGLRKGVLCQWNPPKQEVCLRAVPSTPLASHSSRLLSAGRAPLDKAIVSKDWKLTIRGHFCARSPPSLGHEACMLQERVCRLHLQASGAPPCISRSTALQRPSAGDCIADCT